MHHLLAKTMTVLTLGAAASLTVAHADNTPLWSLAIGVPGLIANIGNAYPATPQPVYVAPPVQYVPAPGYYVAPPYYAPVPQYPYERRHREHDERRHWEDDREDR
jgi:hypothetical protein